MHLLCYEMLCIIYTQTQGHHNKSWYIILMGGLPFPWSQLVGKRTLVDKFFKL